MPGRSRRAMGSPFETAAMAMTLSRLIAASATAIVPTARHSLSEAATACSSAVSPFASFTAIHKSSRPPTTLRNSICSNCEMMSAKTIRRAIAVPAPSMMPILRCLGGSERQASAMTTALSPDSSRSIQTICRIASNVAADISMRGPSNSPPCQVGQMPLEVKGRPMARSGPDGKKPQCGHTGRQDGGFSRGECICVDLWGFWPLPWRCWERSRCRLRLRRQ